MKKQPLSLPLGLYLFSVVGVLGRHVKGGGDRALVSLLPPTCPQVTRAPPNQYDRRDPHNSSVSWIPILQTSTLGPPANLLAAFPGPGPLPHSVSPPCQAHPLQMAFSASDLSSSKLACPGPLGPCVVTALSSSLPVMFFLPGAWGRQGWEKDVGDYLGAPGNFGHMPGFPLAYK